MNRDLCLLVFYAFMTATFEFPDVAFRIYCIKFLDYSPATFAMVTSTAVVPWSVKPVWGFIIDNSSRRKLAIVMCTIGFILSWVLIAFRTGLTPIAMTTLLMCSSFFLCYMDVMADAELVKRVKLESPDVAGTLQSYVWGCRAVGSLLACLLGGYAAATQTNEFVFTATALIIVPGSVALVYCTKDAPPCGCADVWRRVRMLKSTLRRREIFRPCIFVLILASMPSCYYALVSFYQETLQFTPMQFAIVAATEHLAHMQGAAMFKYKFRKIKFTTLFRWGIAILFFLRMLQLVLIMRWNSKIHVSDMAFAICESVAFSIVGQIMIMPICLVGARACPKGIEGSLYSTIMAISNMGGLIAAYSGAALTKAYQVENNDFTNMWKLSITCTAASAIPAFFVHLMPNETPQSAGDGLELVNSTRQTGQEAFSSQTQVEMQEEQKT